MLYFISIDNIMPKDDKERDFSNDDMRIFPIQKTIDDMPLKRPINPILPTLPTTFLFCMGSGHGKTSLITNLIFRDEFYKDIFENILYISPTVLTDNSSQPFLSEEMEDIVTIRDDAEAMDQIITEYIDWLKANFDKKDKEKPNPPVNLIIADDISGYLRRSGTLSSAVSRNRHTWTSLFISNQTLRDVPRPIRTLCKCVFLSRCTNDIEVQAILEEYAGNFLGGKDQMMQVWQSATEQKYNYLMINMADESNVRIFQIGSEGMFEFHGVSSNTTENHPMGGDVPDEMPEEEVDPLKEDQDPFCDKCNQSFKNINSLTRHKLTKRHRRKAGEL